MSFSDHKITQFTHKIVDLPDQPNLPADELKARFDSSPEELRQSVNAICDEGDTLAARVDQHGTQINQISMEKFPDDTIKESNLHPDLAVKINGKADTAGLMAEQTARESADSALDTRMTSAESTISTHTTQIAQKCQIYIGTYTGDNTASRTINLGFRPKAVLVLQDGSLLMINNHIYGSLALSSRNAMRSGHTTLSIVSNGFMVYYDEDNEAYTNDAGAVYHYIAFR